MLMMFLSYLIHIVNVKPLAVVGCICLVYHKGTTTAQGQYMSLKPPVCIN